MAVTLVVVKSTVTALFVVPVRLTVRVSVPLVSLTRLVVTLKLRMAESLVVIVTVRRLVPIEQFVGLLRRRLIVSLFSAAGSFITARAKVFVVSPAAKLRRPLVARKSLAAVAVPLVSVA